MSLPTVTALPTAPSRSDDADTFVSRADAFVAAQQQFVTEMNAVIAAIPALVIATNYNSTSATSNTIGTGSKSFTVQTGKLYQVGQFVIAVSSSGPTNWMAGQVTSYDGVTGALVVNVLTTSGSGTKTDWIISPTVAGNIGSLAAIASSGSGADLTAASVTYAKVQNVSATARLLGRATAGAGVMEEISLGTNLSLSGSVLNVSSGTATLGNGDYGDITVTVSGTVMTIDPGVVTYTKMQNVSATDKLLGRSTAGAGVVEEIACTSVARTLIAQSSQANMRSTGLGLGSISTFAEATAAEYRANTAARAISTDKAWAAADYVTLTDAATIALDFSTGFNFTVSSLAGNRTLGNPTNTKNGQTGCIELIQDATGGRTLTFSSNWKNAGGTAPTLSTAANAKDYLYYQVISSTFILITGIVKGAA